VAEHQCGELGAAVSEEYVGADRERAYMQLDQGCKDRKIRYSYRLRRARKVNRNWPK